MTPSRVASQVALVQGDGSERSDSLRSEGVGVKEKIAECATRIRALLEQTPEVNMLRLSELLGERNVLAYQALGWLARDDRVHYTQKGSQVFISRHDAEADAPPDRNSPRRDS